MQLIQENIVRNFIQEEFDSMDFCAQQKQSVYVEGIVIEVMLAQNKQIEFAEKNRKTSPVLYAQQRLESSVRFKIRKMIEVDLKKNSAPAVIV